MIKQGKKLCSSLLLFSSLLVCTNAYRASDGVVIANQMPVAVVSLRESDIDEMIKINDIFQQVSLLIVQKNFQEAISRLTQILPRLNQVYGPNHTITLNTLLTLARLYERQGLFSDAEPLYLRLLAISETTFGPEHKNTVTYLLHLGALYINHGADSKAEPFYLRSLSILEKSNNSSDHELSIILTNLGMLYRRLGAYDKAAHVLLRALLITEKMLGPNHVNTADSLNNIASVYVLQGFYVKAEQLFNRAITIKVKSLGPDHPDIAVSIGNLASLHISSGNYAKAESLLLQSLRIRYKAQGRQHRDVAIILNNLALLYKIQGYYSKAEPLYLRALEIDQKTYGLFHGSTATSFSNLGTLYDSKGEYYKAQLFLLRALAIREKLLTSDHPDLLANLNNLALVFMKQGAYEKAEPLFLRALAITEKTMGPDHPSTASILNNLGLFYKINSVYSKAESLYLRALEITEKSFGSGHPDTAKSLNNIALLYVSQGAFTKAEPLHRRSLQIYEQLMGPDHPETAISLNNLAHLYKARGDYDKAEPLYNRALVINEKVFGPDHSNTSTSLNNLASLYASQRDHAKAEGLLLRALAIDEKVLGMDNPSTAISLNNLALSYVSQGFFSRGEPLLWRALKINEMSLGSTHLSSAISLSNLADLYVRQAAHTKAEPLLRRSIGIQSLFLQSQLPFLPEASRHAQVKALDDSWEFAFTGAERSESSAELALFSRLNRYGLLLDIEQRQALLARAPGVTQVLAEQIAALTTQLADINTSPSQRHALGKRREQLEKELYLRLPALKPALVEPSQVARSLPAGSRLVEFQRYQPFDAQHHGRIRWGDPRYLALVLNPSGKTRAVDLGPSAAIDSLIVQALRISQSSGADPTALWQQVHEMVFPVRLRDLLAGSNHWILAPDGELNRIPFAALPARTDPQRRLAESVSLQIVSSGRSLLSQSISNGIPTTRPLVLADPDFGPLPANGGGWNRLVASAREGRTISTLLNADLYEGSTASTMVLSKATNPSLVHVASHGYYASAKDLPLPVGSPQPWDGKRSVITGLPSRSVDAMLNSGIVLSGANRSVRPDLAPVASLSVRPKISDDGYLSAKEVAQLNLRGTKLVVLSACDTASGDQQSGEGLYGLQRALSVAGAQSTLLTLWSVDDEATATFMERYYTLLKQGKGRMEALLAVQEEFRTNPLVGAWEDYRYWAPFQLVGETGPINGL